MKTFYTFLNHYNGLPQVEILSCFRETLSSNRKCGQVHVRFK